MDQILEIYGRVYDLVINEAKLVEDSGSSSKSGHTFEDVVARGIYDACYRTSYQCKPARHTPNLPTFSGMKHQFDCWFGKENLDYVIECKRRKASTKDQIYYLNARIIDYILGLKKEDGNFDRRIKGIFVSTAPVDDNSLAYAFAYGMTVIEPLSPPLELLLIDCKEHSTVEAVHRLEQALPKFNPIFDDTYELQLNPETLVRDYRYLVKLSRERSNSR